uniref:Uncharacterized protein n=1 Tax=Dunaliella tertiolecta TaxID=3047 RepID=A0A7S3QN11_DUNTE
MDNTFNDFPVKTRRHYPNANKSSISLGMTPEQEADILPGHITRSRVAHDTADMYQDPENFTSITKRQETGPSHFTTTYMAQTQGLNEGKRPTGKKQVHPPAYTHSKGVGSIISATAPTAPRRTPNEVAALQLGTTKASQHVPGYTGHVISDPQARSQRVNERSVDKAAPLHMLNYKGTVPG